MKALTINPAALTITYTATAASQTVGQSGQNFTGRESATGLVNSDTLASVTWGIAIYKTTATKTRSPGSYPINGSGLSGSSRDYIFNFVQAASGQRLTLGTQTDRRPNNLDEWEAVFAIYE